MNVWIVDSGDEYHRYGMLTAHSDEFRAYAEIARRAGVDVERIHRQMRPTSVDDDGELLSGVISPRGGMGAECFYVDRVEIETSS